MALESAADFTRLLLAWFEQNGRDYPWRRTRDPYCVFVSECMLQRTTPGHAVAVYEEFLERYPTPQAASLAPDAEVLELTRPLGLRRRSLLLRKALVEVVREYGGRIPDDEDALKALPGVGPYTARAVLCFAYRRDLALVDVNVVRVLERAVGLRSVRRRPHTDRRLWEAVDGIIPAGRSREFNLALIDLAASTCLKHSPRCSQCPVLTICSCAEGCS